MLTIICGCWKNGTDRHAQCRVATNPQIVKNEIPAKDSKAKCNKTRNACAGTFTGKASVASAAKHPSSQVFGLVQ